MNRIIKFFDRNAAPIVWGGIVAWFSPVAGVVVAGVLKVSDLVTARMSHHPPKYYVPPESEPPDNPKDFEPFHNQDLS